MSRKRNILLVDDDRATLRMYADYLREQGFSVYEEQSGEEALARIIESRNVDLMVTDIMMARMNGWELLDYIRKDMNLDEAALPVVVMSAVESIDLEMDYMRHRANDWVTKPIKPLAKLADKVRALLGLQEMEGEEDESYDNDRGS